MKPIIWIKMGILALWLLFCFQEPGFSAGDFQYFGSDIDFWHEKPLDKPTADPQAPRTSSTAINHEGDFQWQKYLDPKNKEFFKEGDYTPPEPFMEIVRNPTDENIKMWFAYIDKKNELSHRLQERMQAYMAKNSVQQGEQSQLTMKSKLASLPVTEPNAKRYRFRMYFDSHCPHCRKMFETLGELQSRGFYVEAKQVDSDSRGLEGLSIPTSRATPGELNEKDIQSVPVLFIGDLEKKQVYRLTGYQTTAAIFSAIAQANTRSNLAPN